MTTQATPRRWMRWALIASVGLNLAFAGLIVGAIVKGPPPPGLVPGIWTYARALPDPYRKDLGRALRDSRRDWSDTRDALRGQRAALAAALTADPFVPEAVESVLEDGARIGGALEARGTDLLVAQIAQMSPEERAGFAEELLEGSRRHGDKRP